MSEIIDHTGQQIIDLIHGQVKEFHAKDTTGARRMRARHPRRIILLMKLSLIRFSISLLWVGYRPVPIYAGWSITRSVQAHVPLRDIPFL
jgi:hypothetical protein